MFAIDEVRGPHDPAFDEFQRPSNGTRCVVKTGKQVEARVMNERSIERYRRSRGTPTEEVNRAALANQAHRRFPRLGLSHSFDDGVKHRGFWDRLNEMLLMPDVDDLVSP